MKVGDSNGVLLLIWPPLRDAGEPSVDSETDVYARLRSTVEVTGIGGDIVGVGGDVEGTGGDVDGIGRGLGLPICGTS